MTDVRIPLFEEIFKQPVFGFSQAKSAAAYYTLLIENFPTSFKVCSDIASRFGVKPGKLAEGRSELLAKGLIAGIQLINDPGETKFGREMYLPVNPHLVWKEYTTMVNLELSMEREEIDEIEERIAQLSKMYERFGVFGFGADNGNITAYYTSHWLLLTIVNNLEKTSKLDLMLSGLESFELPFRRYYERMLRKGLSMRVLFDPTKMQDERIKHNITKLKDLSPDKFDIRTTPVKFVNSRRLISNNFAIDGRKILKNTKTEENDKNIPTYYSGTIYFDKYPIDRLAKNFDSAWEKGEIIKI